MFATATVLRAILSTAWPLVSNDCALSHTTLKDQYGYLQNESQQKLLVHLRAVAPTIAELSRQNIRRPMTVKTID